MIYEVSQKKRGKGDSQRIELREVGDGLYEVTLDDRVIRVDAVKSGRTIYSVIEDGKQFEAMVDEKGEHGFDVLLAGRLYHLEAVDERSRLLASTAQSVASGKQVVSAEMPGKVVKIQVAVGDTVSQGQGVLIIEAMKMENDITSPIDGVVSELSVSEGQTVETGAPLFVVEPAE